MFDCNEKDLIDYDTYLKTVKRRIQRLNDIADSYVMISQIDIQHIKPSQSDKTKWEFLYKIETGTKFVDYKEVMGWIKHTDFHTWKLEKVKVERNKKLKQLGI